MAKEQGTHATAFVWRCMCNLSCSRHADNDDGEMCTERIVSLDSRHFIAVVMFYISMP